MTKGAVAKKTETKSSRTEFKDRSKPDAVRMSNCMAAKAVGDAVRTSLGPKGMDKMIQEGKGDVTVTNDGATILKRMKLVHPAAKLLVDLSQAQDIEAGDGTTTVVIIASSLLDQAKILLNKGLHPTQISESFQRCSDAACEILTKISRPLNMQDRDSLLKNATTSLNSKAVSQYSSILSPIAVDAVLRIRDPSTPNVVNLNDIRVIRKLGGTVEDTEMMTGLLLKQKVESACGVTRVDKAKIGLIQFCISPPKTDMENTVCLSDYAQMDRVYKEERTYILNIIKAVKKSGCNVLLIQKSILRDAVNELALHYLGKMKIMTIKDIEREEVEFICKTLKLRPIASVDHFTADMLGHADLVEEVPTGFSKCVKVTGIQNPGNTVSVLVRASNRKLLDEADRALHDALCVIRCLVKNPAIIAGGGAPEIELAQKLMQKSTELTGVDQYCMRAFAEAMEIIPYTLAENAGLNPMKTVTELRHKHALGEANFGINVRKGAVTNILEENVVQPLLVSLNAVKLAAETVRCILKIDDIVSSRE